MKSGATFLIGISSDIEDIEKVESVIFTIRGKEELQKNYPEDVSFDENHNFLIPLTQEETTLLAGQYGHKVLVEGQVNFVDKSVNKTETVDFFISGTLATEIIEGNTPSAYPITEVSLRFMDGIVVADLNPDAFDEKIAEKVAELTADMQEEIDNKVDKDGNKGLSTEDFTTEEKERLATVEIGAQKNKVNSVNSRTGDVVLTALNIGALPDTTTHLSGDIPVSQKGSANGVAELDENGKVISSQLPSYVDDVLEFPNLSDFPTKGESGKIYIATETNISYRWTGSTYTEISSSIALGETSSTAYRGDRGKVAYDHSQTIGNPHQTTKADLGLENVDNTSDANKPVSTATQTELDKKVDKVTGKSLISVSEISRLANVDNYDDTEVRTELSEKLTSIPSSLGEIDAPTYADVDERIEALNESVNRLTNYNTVRGKLITIYDAVDGQKAKYISEDALVYDGFNMIKIHADRNRGTTNGVAFTVDENDDNTVTFKRVADPPSSTSNAYSYGTINVGNATLLKAGTYYLKTFGSTSSNVGIYFNFIANGTNTTKVYKLDSTQNGIVITLDVDTYVGARIQVTASFPRAGESGEGTVSVMYSKVAINKWFPTEYMPYKEPKTDGVLSAISVVENPSDDDFVVYQSKNDINKTTTKLKIGTFNVGDYSGNGGWKGDVNVPLGDKTEYLKYISSLDVDILCTQEDREFWDIANQVTTFSEIYSKIFKDSCLVSKSLSHGNINAKAIYSNLNSIISGRYTFENQGYNPETSQDYWNSFTYKVAEVGNNTVLMISVHLAPKQNNVAVRKSQIGELKEFVKGFGIDKVIIGGDFNVWADEYDAFGEGWTLANHGKYGDFDTYDSSNHHPFDNIIVSEGILVSNVEVHSNSFKDHFALTATITI